MPVSVRFAMAVLAAFCLTLAPGCGNRPRPTGPPGTAKNTEPDPAVVRITAEDLDEEFEEDEAAANAQYKGKVIEVTGKVHKIDRADLTVEVGTGDETVDCVFGARDGRQLGQLKVGQEVVIRGTCVGLVDDGKTKTVTLEGCSLVR